MARDDPHFRLRIPTDIKARIEAEAAKSGRSINSEIVARLSWSLEWNDWASGYSDQQGGELGPLAHYFEDRFDGLSDQIQRLASALENSDGRPGQPNEQSVAVRKAMAKAEKVRIPGTDKRTQAGSPNAVEDDDDIPF